MKSTFLLIISIGLLFSFATLFHTPLVSNATTPTPTSQTTREPISLSNVDRLEIVYEIEFENEIMALTWVSEDNQLAVASGNDITYFRDLNNLNLPYTLSTRLKNCLDEVECITALAFDADTHHLVASRRDGTLDIWNFEKLREEKIIISDASEIYGVAFHPTENYLVSGDVGGHVTIWNLAKGETSAVQHYGGFISDVDFSPNGEMIAFVGGWEPLIGIWYYSQDKSILFATEQTDGVYSVTFSQDNTKLIAGGWDGSIEIWDIASQELENSFRLEDGWITDIEVSHDNSVFFSASLEGNLRGWSWQSEDLLLLDVDYPQWDIALNWDGTLLASGGDDKILRIWAVAP